MINLPITIDTHKNELFFELLYLQIYSIFEFVFLQQYFLLKYAPCRTGSSSRTMVQILQFPNY